MLTLPIAMTSSKLHQLIGKLVPGKNVVYKVDGGVEELIKFIVSNQLTREVTDRTLKGYIVSSDVKIPKIYFVTSSQLSRKSLTDNVSSFDSKSPMILYFDNVEQNSLYIYNTDKSQSTDTVSVCTYLKGAPSNFAPKDIKTLLWCILHSPVVERNLDTIKDDFFKLFYTPSDTEKLSPLNEDDLISWFKEKINLTSIERRNYETVHDIYRHYEAAVSATCRNRRNQVIALTPKLRPNPTVYVATSSDLSVTALSTGYGNGTPGRVMIFYTDYKTKQLVIHSAFVDARLSTDHAHNAIKDIDQLNQLDQEVMRLSYDIPRLKKDNTQAKWLSLNDIYFKLLKMEIKVI